MTSAYPHLNNAQLESRIVQDDEGHWAACPLSNERHPRGGGGGGIVVKVYI